MNCSFGKNLHSSAVTGNISTLHADGPHQQDIPEVASVRLRHIFAAHAAVSVATISSSAIHEMIRLKASWSASVV